MARRFLFAGLLSLTATTALAVPNSVTVNDTNRGATVTLTVLDQTIAPDNVSPCTVTVVIDESNADWTSDEEDSFDLWVYEADPLIFDDETIFEITRVVPYSATRPNGVYQETFDCSGDFESDGFALGQTIELYAQVSVNKDDCGFFCNGADPQTDEIDSLIVGDDAREENDAQSAASAVGAGRTNDLIGADADYLSRDLSQISRVQFDILHAPTAGRLNGTVVDSTGAVVPTTVTEIDDRTRVVAEVLPIGAASLVVTPADAANPNFYDLSVSESAVATECTPGETDVLPCGNCGGIPRTCSNFGQWDAGDECLNEGECAQGATETEACDSGAERTRTCGGDCTWEPYGECEGGSCSPGETVACYTGEAGTEGIGACTGGERVCENGTFSECRGEVTPVAEICGNGTDDDCDDDDDLRDDDCDNGLALLGEPCDGDGDCDAQWTCLGDPDPDRFIDGYCGDDAACTGEANECTADGVCADLGDSEYCLLACGDGIGCRFGYTCATLPEGDACIPRCRSNADCFFEDAATCNVGTGLCEGEGGPNGNDTGDNVAEINGCQCDGTGAPAAGWLLLVGAVFGLRRRRAA